MEEVICIDSSFDESNDVLSQDVKELVTHRESLADTNPNKSSLHVMKADITGDVICEFLEVAFHQILFHRGLYPKEIFRSCKKYHVAVQMCMYPDLTKYILNVLKALKPMVAMNHAKKVVLLVLEDGNFFEQFVFEFGFPRNHGQKSDDQFFFDLELSLRESLLKIAAYDAPAPKHPSNCSFDVLVHLDKNVANELLYDNDAPIKWILDDSKAISQPKLYPLKTIKDSPYVKLQLYVLGS